MLSKSYEERLLAWKEFRSRLNNDEDPIQSSIDFWNSIPKSQRNLDPYDPSTWPDPWEMIEENSYCNYTAILGVAYTLMLTENYKDWHYEIKVGIDKQQSNLYYMLVIGDKIVGFDQEKSIHILEPPKDIHIEKTHVLSDRF